MGWIKYLWREYADGVNEKATTNSLKEGTDFIVRESNSSSYELEDFIAFLQSRHLFEGYPHEKILSRHFPLVVKLAKGYSFPHFPLFLRDSVCPFRSFHPQPTTLLGSIPSGNLCICSNFANLGVGMF